jgi:hypothetical protein
MHWGVLAADLEAIIFIIIFSGIQMDKISSSFSMIHPLIRIPNK